MTNEQKAINDQKFNEWSGRKRGEGYLKKGKNIPLRQEQVKQMLANATYIDKSNGNRRVTEVDMRSRTAHFYMTPYDPTTICIFEQGVYSGPFAWLAPTS
jgi:hypothetical protein